MGVRITENGDELFTRFCLEPQDLIENSTKINKKDGQEYASETPCLIRNKLNLECLT